MQVQEREWLTPQEAAEYLAVSTGTLRQWRYLEYGPKPAKRKRIIRYSKAVIDRWLEDGRG
jgi:DNA-binding transcriptional regulator YiaG